MSQISFSLHLVNILTVIIYIFHCLHIIIGMCVPLILIYTLHINVGGKFYSGTQLQMYKMLPCDSAVIQYWKFQIPVETQKTL